MEGQAQTFTCLSTRTCRRRSGQFLIKLSCIPSRDWRMEIPREGKNEIIMVCGVTGRCQKTTSQNVVRYSSRELGGTGGIRGNQEISNNKWRSERRGWTGVIVITSNSDKLAAVTQIDTATCGLTKLPPNFANQFLYNRKEIIIHFLQLSAD